MAGTIPLSMTQQFDVYGEPLAGGQLYIIQVGTVSTPQNAYQDTALTIALPYPITLDAAGRVPQFFLADGFVKIRLQDRNGVVQLAADSVMVIGPSAGGGGGGSSVDPTTLIQTGMMMFSHTTASIVGFVRLNGRTVGSSTSSATERANADTQALFLFLWPDTALAVSGGRGVSAAADWSANKNIVLPDWRGYTLGGLGDMGNSDAGRLTSTYFGTSPIVLGAAGGLENKTLVTANFPPYSPAGTIVNGAITNTPNVSGTNATQSGSAVGGTVLGAYTAVTVAASQATSTFTGTAQGGSSTPFSQMQPTKLITFFMKL